MHKTLIPVALLGALLPAQGQDTTFLVPGTNTVVKYQRDGGATHSYVSRDAGRNWTRQNEIDHKLHIRFGTFDPKNSPVIPAKLHAGPDNRLFIVQFHTNIIREFRARLNGMGAELHHYLPSQSYLVRMEPALSRKVAGLPFVRSVSALHVAYKLDPEIIVGLGSGNGKTVRYTVVLVDKRRDVLGLETRVKKLGAKMMNPAQGGILFEANMTEAQMLAVAADNRTLWIEKSSMPEVDIDNARIQGGMNYVETQASIDGKGMYGHIVEGVYAFHTEFAARPPYRTTPIGRLNGSPSGHGNATAGEIYARGARFGYKGLLPFAQCFYTNYASIINTNNRYNLTQGLVNNDKVSFQTASWGYARTLLYTSRSAEMDDIIYDFDLFVTQSQSNAGATSQPRNSRAQAWAKNICSVGGFRHRNNSSAADDYWGRSGSTGPASDGRIGVTLSAYYDSIKTTGYSSTSYTTGFGGTSGATPIINGLGGGANQMFAMGLFGYKSDPGWANRHLQVPHFTTTKSLLIATANQVPYNASGTTFGANRYQQGWGFPSLNRLYDERNSLLVIDELDVLTAGNSRTYFVFAKGGRFVASMNHADQEAASFAGIHRLNSVDLKVKTSNGTTYWGNNGLTSGAFSTAGGSANDRDTEETVILNNAPRGTTVVTVSAPVLRRDGHRGTGALDTSFALVVQGIAGNRDLTTGMRLDVNSVAKGNLRVSLTNGPGGWTEGFTLFSLDVSRPLGTGDVFGLEFDGLAASILSQPVGAGNVFHFNNTGGVYPNAIYVFHPAIANAVSGVTLDAVAFVLNGSGTILSVSNVDREKIK